VYEVQIGSLAVKAHIYTTKTDLSFTDLAPLDLEVIATGILLPHTRDQEARRLFLLDEVSLCAVKPAARVTRPASRP
jgi:hypothetical protein